MCAACHRIHTAQFPKLLLNSNTTLCLTCHGSAATGADTDVLDGTYEGADKGAQHAGLNGGGFIYAKQDTSLTGTPTSGEVTSIHSVEGTSSYSSTATLWGAGAMNSGAGAAYDLYCTSCHNPHGGDNYRSLKSIVNSVPLNGTYYTFTVGISLPVSTVNGGPPVTSPDNRSMVCLTCHFAHGSKANMDVNSGGITWPGGGGTPKGSGRSSLLRLDNRGVCQNCHNKGG